MFTAVLMDACVDGSVTVFFKILGDDLINCLIYLWYLLVGFFFISVKLFSLMNSSVLLMWSLLKNPESAELMHIWMESQSLTHYIHLHGLHHYICVFLWIPENVMLRDTFELM